MAEPPYRDLELEQSKFRSDVDAVRRYGQTHEEFVEVRFENEPTLRLVVLMVGDHLDAHQNALRALVDHPDQLEVRRTPFDRTHLEVLRQEVKSIAERRPRAFMQFGIGAGRLDIQLAADQEDLAASLHRRFGDAVELRVGVFAYPPEEEGDVQGSGPAPIARPALPLVPSDEFEIELESDLEVPSGATRGGVLRIRNRGNAEVAVQTNGGVTARVVDRHTGEGVGGFVGAQRAPLIIYRIAPGAEVSIPLLVGTASSVRRLGYAVPPGEWAIEVPITIEGRGQFRTSLLPLRILPPTPAEVLP